MTAGHFIFIPSVLLVGVVIGWVLGSRAARDAFAMELKRRAEEGKRPEVLRKVRTSGERISARARVGARARPAGPP